jgi:signal transduction histidine kinase
MNGDRVAVSGTVAPLRDELDALNGVVLAVRDVTAEREVDRQKSNFIAVASHQLRTPLSAIRWFLDLLLGGDAGPLKPAQRDFLSDVHISTLRMSRLVDDLLNVSRIESGKFRVMLQPIAAAGFIQDVIKENRALIESKKIAFETDVPEDLPKITIDTSLSLQALSNVLSNAIKYTMEGGKVTVTARVVGAGVEVEVADTGLGIPSNQRHRVYEKFWRGENVLLKETVGTGLGLYLTKTVLDLTGSVIRFESEEGKGSRFFLTFPIAQP